MKKLLALLLVMLLSLSATALAASYTCDFLTFDYDDSFFEVAMDDQDEDGCMIMLTDADEGFIRIRLSRLDDGESFPTAQEIAELQKVEVNSLDEWAGFKNVLSFEFTDGDYSETAFIIPVSIAGGDVDGVLSVNIGGTQPKDEAAAALRDDRISAVVDSLKLN